jgi:poly-gamma-glutamate capsule biosynthesis protein CapA/YwtB (metallophosphatase superfamily)
MHPGAHRTWWALLAGLSGPPAVAAALVPLRHAIDNANVALLLATSVVAVASLGRRSAAVVAAVSAMVWFDFFHTQPYQSFRINSRDDVVTATVLLAVGLLVGELAVRGRRHRAAAREGSSDIALIHSVAELVAAGEPADYVVLVVATQLQGLLALRDCRFERPASDRLMARIERSGDVVIGELRWGVHSMGFPGREVELPVVVRGETVGRYVLVPTPGVPVSFDRRVVAVAVADQVGSALASSSGVAC